MAINERTELGAIQQTIDALAPMPPDMRARALLHAILALGMEWPEEWLLQLAQQGRAAAIAPAPPKRRKHAPSDRRLGPRPRCVRVNGGGEPCGHAKNKHDPRTGRCGQCDCVKFAPPTEERATNGV